MAASLVQLAKRALVSVVGVLRENVRETRNFMETAESCERLLFLSRDGHICEDICFEIVEERSAMFQPPSVCYMQSMPCIHLPAPERRSGQKAFSRIP